MFNLLPIFVADDLITVPLPLTNLDKWHLLLPPNARNEQKSGHQDFSLTLGGECWVGDAQQSRANQFGCFYRCKPAQ